MPFSNKLSQSKARCYSVNFLRSYYVIVVFNLEVYIINKPLFTEYNICTDNFITSIEPGKLENGSKGLNY